MQRRWRLLGITWNTKKQNPFVKALPTYDWFSCFMKRHPCLTSRLPEQLKAAKAISMGNPTVKKHWFELVNQKSEDYVLMDRPDLIYNVDKTAMPLDPKRLKVICKKGIDHLFRIIGCSGKETITVNGCANATGQMLPPYVIYSGKILRDSWVQNGPEGARYNVTENGWMNSICFIDWFERLFVPSLQCERLIVLIFDGQKSHVKRIYLKNIIDLKGYLKQ